MATHAVPGTGLELILNAAEGVLQIVVTEDEAILCAQEWYRSERATEILAPALAELATSLGIRWSDLRRIACVRGPGSFTGIRLTLATAAALRRCGRAQLAGLEFDAIAGLESRGFLFGMPIAYKLHKAFIPIRKEGKLPLVHLGSRKMKEQARQTL